jgi:hypothetical protein
MAKREIVEELRKYIFILRSEGITVDKAYLNGTYNAEMILLVLWLLT